MAIRTYLLLGSNLGDRVQLLQVARVRIEILAGTVVASSSLYETAPWGKADQPAFVNQVLAADTDLPPRVLMATLLDIEKSLGRVRDEEWGPRPIDIDLLFYGDQVVNEPGLVIPHPSLHQRRFTLAPLGEIARELVHPVLKKTVGELLAECEDPLDVKVIPKR